MLRILFLNLIAVGVLFAHPHTFIDIYPTIKHKENTITTIHFDWKFDVMTSQLLVMEFDPNMDGKIDKEENIYVDINYFQPMKDYGFYTDIKIDKKSIFTNPKNFQASIDKEQRIVFSFDIELNTKKEKLYIDFYDEESLTAFMLKKEFVTSNIPFQVIDVDNDFYFTYRLEFK